MTFISIHSVIIYVVFFGVCMRCTWLCSLKPGVTDDEEEEEEEEIHPSLTKHSRFTSSTHRGGRVVISDNDDVDACGGDIPWDDITR
jgi:hypothetical protein